MVNAMAKKVLTQIIDDIDGAILEPGKGETVLFSLDGVSYEIDLSAENAAALREVIAGYAKNGRRIGGSTRPQSSRPGRAGRSSQLAAVREWAGKNGFEVASRGRVPESVVAAYEAAH